MRPHLESSVQYWAHHYKEDIGVPENAQRKAVELMESLEHKSYKKWLRELGIFSLEKSQERPYHSLQLPESSQLGGWFLLPGNQQYNKRKQE